MLPTLLFSILLYRQRANINLFWFLPLYWLANIIQVLLLESSFRKTYLIQIVLLVSSSHKKGSYDQDFCAERLQLFFFDKLKLYQIGFQEKILKYSIHKGKTKRNFFCAPCPCTCEQNKTLHHLFQCSVCECKTSSCQEFRNKS